LNHIKTDLGIPLESENAAVGIMNLLDGRSGTEIFDALKKGRGSRVRSIAVEYTISSKLGT
jgi:hypothetical protein